MTKTETSPLLPMDSSAHNPFNAALEYAGKLSSVLFAVQVALLLLFLSGTTYPEEYSHVEYHTWKDIMAMLLIGFGYLMTFLKQYGLGAVGFTMLLTVVSMQLNIVVELLMRAICSLSTSSEIQVDINTTWPMPVSMDTLIDSEFSAATLLITFGALIGRTSPYQMLVLTISQSFFYAFHKVVIIFGVLAVEDVGGTMTIHMFGAYFGLAASYALGPPTGTNGAEANAVSDVFAFIGTAVLWVFWPSFVGATETATDLYEMRCTTNTVMALLGSTAAAFWTSHKLCHGKFDPVHIANSTLAGGVAIGSSARLAMGPGAAALVGAVSGVVSVLGYVHGSPFLETLGIYDTCGVGNLHGLPSLVGGIASALIVIVDPSAEFLEHSSFVQPFIQVVGVIATVAVAAASGYYTGLLIKDPKVKLDKDDSAASYEDSVWWHAEYFE